MLSVLSSTHMLLAVKEAGVGRYFYSSFACVYAAYKRANAGLLPLREEDAYPAMFEDGYGWEKLLSVRLTGWIPGPESDAVVVATDASGADLVRVVLSTPKQKRWMAEHRNRREEPALFSVGAAFDFHAGLKPQALGWLQQRGLEWAYRLAKEPRRLWRRHLRNNPAYLARIALRPPRLTTTKGALS
ncbi:WecB/TagA/CpsF family glycosyltransferase [Streptomyces sp. NPDC057291]|uniref:WecB/TagA/CpsF family glycosyltransferase n=1 Tax=Streptomyces sp. NPDC057291 TaxID=3346087 RepID=UPI00363477BA